jgi:hypothetical protein
MRKLALLVVILIMGIAFAGCQQTGLSEEDVRNIVQEEVTNQLATGQLKGIVRQEVTRQLASIDELKVSELYIKNKDGKIVAEFGGGSMGGYLNFINPDGDKVLFFSDSGLTIHRDEHMVATFGTLTFESGAIGGQLMLCNPGGKRIASLVSTEDGDGYIDIRYKDGQLAFVAP